MKGSQEKQQPNKSQYYICMGMLLTTFLAWVLHDVQPSMDRCEDIDIAQQNQAASVLTPLEPSESSQLGLLSISTKNPLTQEVTLKVTQKYQKKNLPTPFFMQHTTNLPTSSLETVNANESSTQDPADSADPTPKPADPATDNTIDPDFNINYDMPVRPEMKVYLTFDDGPTEHTEEILNTLNEYDAIATFFMLEPHIRLYPNLVQRMEKEGHALGSHGVTHKRHIFFESTESMISEMDQTIAAIREVSGVGSSLVRVPYGTVPNVSKNQMQVLIDHGYKIWDWNVDSSDWRTKDARYVATTIKQVQKLREQEIAPIILLHDMKGTAAHLSSLLEYLRQNGYVFCILDPSLLEYRIGSP